MDFTLRVMVATLGQAVKDNDETWCSTTGRDWCAIMGWSIDPMKLLRAARRSRKGRQERLARALVANMQRSDLSPIEEARGFAALRDMRMTNTAIGQKLGVSTARVAQLLRLLELEQPIQDLIARDKLSHDARLVDALMSLPAGEVRVKTAKTLADRRATIRAGVEACNRVKTALRAERIPADETPAMRLAVKRAGDVNRTRWDALAQVGRVPPWLFVEISARNVCERCGLRDVASETTCGECALVSVLRELLGKTQR